MAEGRDDRGSAQGRLVGVAQEGGAGRCRAQIFFFVCVWQLTFLSASFACASDMMAAVGQKMANKMLGLVPRSRKGPSCREQK